MGSSESGVGADDWNFEKFKGQTDVRTSVLHFVTMALCDYRYATNSSTVHDIAQLLSRNSGQHFFGNQVMANVRVN